MEHDDCRSCGRPATERDKDGDPACMYCAAVDRAYIDEWENLEPKNDGWKGRQRMKGRRDRLGMVGATDASAA